MNLFTPSRGFVEAVLNHPAVRFRVQGGTGRLSPNNLPGDCVWRAFSGGWMLFVPIGPDSYEGHVAVVPEYWGAAATAFGKAAISELFNKYGGRRLTAAAPVQLPAVRGYCRRLGLKPVGRDLFQHYFSTEAESWAVS